MRTRDRILLTPAYLLHHSPWRDSSRILEFFTRDHGRISLFARGVRRPGSPLGSVLLPFQRLLVSWVAHGEAGTLSGAELDRASGSEAKGLPPGRIMSGFYLNELILKLSVRHDSQPRVFDEYAAAIEGLRGPAAEEGVLRLFEKRFLDELGYGLDILEDEASLQGARRRLREALASCLEGRELKTREVTREMRMAMK